MDALKLDVMVYPSFLDPPRFVGDDLGPVGKSSKCLLPSVHADEQEITASLQSMKRVLCCKNGCCTIKGQA